ncbi:MAG TPA: hypothetical protein PLE01_06140 [Syntrophothermus lipocalidus]|uniref:hypothetical protein n=1 Tax=Syntrophothermus sp. TaxID=2736299 RepID=UPI00257F3C98|nr:hypothetical protein [Syntrophothermus sp.]NSW82437.1 hypothetical protein [Syntrophothermus sp.]HOV43475.1 hypothetical protein [Syntrophothermus lipocalidus]
MTVRTVDLQVLIPRSSEVARVQHNQQQANQNQQQELTAQLLQQTVRNENTINPSLEGQKALIREREEKGKKDKKRQAAAGKTENEENKLEQGPLWESPGLGGRIDIKA